MQYTYLVRVTEGKLSNLSHWEKSFESGNIYHARSLAITWAKNYFDTRWELGEVDHPSLMKVLPPTETDNLKALSVDVCLVDLENDDEYYIYGADEEFVVSGLKDEADYYIRHQILLESDLIKIFESELDNPHSNDCITSILKVVPTEIYLIRECLEIENREL